MRIRFVHKGNFNNTERFLKKAKNKEWFKALDRYGREGVQALSSATPVDSGLTADSWDYKISINSGSVSIEWFNRNKTKDGVPVAILLQYGHGTGTGGYVKGIDYINPAIQPVFDNIAESVWNEVKHA